MVARRRDGKHRLSADMLFPATNELVRYAGSPDIPPNGAMIVMFQVATSDLVRYAGSPDIPPNGAMITMFRVATSDLVRYAG